MYFYKHFLPIMTFISLQFQETPSVGNEELVVQKTGLDMVTPCRVGLVFYADVNNTSNEVDFEVAVSPDECCVIVGSDEDCDLIEVVGECIDTVPRGTTKTLKVVAPILDPLERRGYCVLHLDSKPKNRQRGTMRDTIKIPFDTRLKNTKQPMKIPRSITPCKRIDEDPLNKCKPVDCETFYNGKRSYFNNKTKRCTEVPICVSNDTDTEVPDVVYDITKNKCRVGKSISDKDIDLIKDLSGGKHRKTKDILIIKNVNRNPTPKTFMFELKNVTNKISQLDNENNILHIDHEKIKKLKETGLKCLMAKYYITNRSSVMFFGGIILFQCCLIFTMVYCMGNKCGGCNKKKVVRKFFNYRQDASVTTPLICTSNIDTETTEFQYLSESSNVDKKIKCYKACQKERKNNVKMSMSDDILSKCLTRRDWSSKPAKSEAIPEIVLAEDNKREIQETINESNYNSNMSSHLDKKASSAKVNFEQEIIQPKRDRKQDKEVKSIVKKIKREKDYEDELLYDMSEKEIKCHSYNDMEAYSNVFKASTHGKKLGFFRTDRSKKGTVSISTEKGAQAAFSNDSIDDFLSERGLIFLADENLSKYSFLSRSTGNKCSSISSEASSKTSKNHNMVKNVLSLLHRRSKHGPSSDPGGKKSSKTDVELIHMSQASVYSSNNDSDYLKCIKIPKDSRSSL